jgi:hypothetical protein
MNEVRFVNVKRHIPKARVAEGVVHLHWLWKKGPGLLRGVSVAAALCGVYVKRPNVTSHIDDVTCPTCKTRAKGS